MKSKITKYVISKQKSGFFTITRKGARTPLRNQNGGAATFRSKKEAQDWLFK